LGKLTLVRGDEEHLVVRRGAVLGAAELLARQQLVDLRQQ